MLRVGEHAIQRLRSRGDAETNAGERSVSRGYIDSFMRSLQISAEDDLHRIPDGMREMSAVVALNG